MSRHSTALLKRTATAALVLVPGTLVLAGCASGPEAPKGGGSGVGGTTSAAGPSAAAGSGGLNYLKVGAVNREGEPQAPVSAEQLLSLTQECPNVVSKHLYALDDGSKVPICGMEGAVYWTADMDIDCDGKPTENKCGPDKKLDCCYQPDTAVHNSKDEPLTSAVTPYVVIPGDFKHPGLHRGAVVAVIYKGRLQYAIFGDTGPKNIIGEASYACAEKLDIPPSALDGGVGGKTVTYIAFTGAGTVPKDIEDQDETRRLGETLAAKLLVENR